jgi:SAM-dependent methyltransferase
VAEDWNEQVGYSGNWFHHSIIYPSIIKILDDISNHRILDIGCGNGHLCRFLNSKNATVTGIDASKKMIIECKKYSNNIEYHLMKAESMALGVGMFDCCIFNNSLQDIKEYTQAINESHRVLKSGGTLIVITRHPCFHPTNDDLGWCLDSLDDINMLSGKGLTGLLNAKQNFNGLHFRMDDYFDDKPHLRNWYGNDTYSYKRTIQNYCQAILSSGFSINDIIEPRPIKEYMQEKPSLFNLLQRIPNFIIYVGEKS